MRDDKSEKIPEELADEELDKVAGGKTVVITGDPPPRGNLMPAGPGASGIICGRTGGGRVDGV